jgi:hypothetical protein
MKSTIVIIALAALFRSIQSKENISTRSVEAEPLFVKVVGEFDPRVDDVYFISAVQTIFDDYCQANIADLIYGFDIAVTFILDETLYDFIAANGTTLITSWCEVWTTFSLSSDLDPSKFSTNSATQFVMNFFASEQSNKIMNRFEKQNNITLSSIEAFEASSDAVKSTLKDSVNNPFDSASQSTKRESNALEVMAGISCGIIFFALLALTLSTLQRRYHKRIAKDDIGRLGIKRQESSNTNTPKIILNPGLTVNPDQTNSEYDDESESEYNDTAVVSNEIAETKENDPPIVSSESFSMQSFDDSDDKTETTQNLHSPTSQYNSTNASSPVWSLFSTSDNTTSPYSTDNIPTRRRWHDDVENELNQLSLPDPSSSGSSTNGTGNIIFESDTASSNSSNT